MYAYDIECYPNVFTITFVNMDKSNDAAIDAFIKADIKDGACDKTDRLINEIDKEVFIISNDVNDAFRLRDFLSLSPTLAGYNNQNYDDILLAYLMDIVHLDVELINEKLYKISNELISTSFISKDDDLYKYKYQTLFPSIDLQKLYHLKYKGLKMVAIQMKWYKIQDLPLNPYSPVPPHLVESLLRYNLNDVLMTRQMLKLKKDELESRIDAMRMYSLDQRVLSTSRPELAKMIISNYIQRINGGNNKFEYKRTHRKYIKFNDIILHFEFEIPEFKAFYEHLKSIKIVIGNTSFNEVFKYKGIAYQFGVGGLHTKDKPQMFEEDDEYTYIDVDADSYYPWLILNHGFEPKHLQGYFLTIFRLIVTTRMKAKKAGKAKLNKEDIDYLEQKANKVKNKKLANILKIVINSSFGQFNDVYSFLLDPLALYSTTVNGQIGLLYVAEKIILAGQEVVSVNTDGIVSKVKKSEIDKYKEVSEKAFADFKATCEFTYYKKYVRTSVNDYITIKTDGDIKLKGDFEYDKLSLHDGFSKGFSQPVVALALVKYYTEGIPIEDTIKNHKDILDFCLSSNIGNQFDLYSIKIVNGQVIEKEIQKHVRYYVSNKGSSLIKRNFNTGSESKMTKGFNKTVFNDFIIKDEYDINYNYYVKEAYKLINKIEGKDKDQLTLF